MGDTGSSNWSEHAFTEHGHTSSSSTLPDQNGKCFANYDVAAYSDNRFYQPEVRFHGPPVFHCTHGDYLLLVLTMLALLFVLVTKTLLVHLVLHLCITQK